MTDEKKSGAPPEATAEDRRRNKRYSFSATAEVVEMVSGARLSTRAADLSRNGCYLDSLNPFPIGSKLRVCIRWSGAELTCTAAVRDFQPGLGMGVAFTNIDNAGKALIESWITKLGTPGLADHHLPPWPFSGAKAAAPAAQTDDLAVRLIDLLQKKGILSANDVASLLRERVL